MLFLRSGLSHTHKRYTLGDYNVAMQPTDIAARATLEADQFIIILTLKCYHCLTCLFPLRL